MAWQVKEDDLKQLANDIIRGAKERGADEADVYIQSGRESEISTRMEKVENLKEAFSQGFGLRVFKGGKLGFCFSSGFHPDMIKIAVNQAVSLADESSSDEHNGLPEQGWPTQNADLELFDKAIDDIPTQRKIQMCLEAEREAFAFDKRITNSEGAGFYDGEATTVIADSGGRSQAFRASYCYLVVSPVAQEDGKLQSGAWYSLKRFIGDLESPREIARIAAERTIRMLGARVPPTGAVPIVFDNLTGASLIGSLLGALNGDAVYKGASFLAGKLGQEVASPLVTLVDDGTIKKGLASTPFDGEGLSTGRKEIVSKGWLNMFMYDTHTARKAGARPTGNAHREYKSLPSIGPYNFHLQAGESSFDEIIKSVKSGLYLTSLMGFGANTVTGDYSLGATGIWIENGELAYPVEGITVASNMNDILKRIDMVGNDLLFMGPVASPTFRVAEMTVSGT